MKLVVFTIKRLWYAPETPSGFTTDGGFLYQMRGISELFDSTTIVAPCVRSENRPGSSALTGHNLSVVPVPFPYGGQGLRRKLAFPLWLLRTLPVILRELLRADAVHVPIPGDIGTIAMVVAVWLRKPLFVRHCGNWMQPKTATDRFVHHFMEKHAGGRNVMLATGGGDAPPSPDYPAVRWIFSTSLTQANLDSCAVTRERTLGYSPRLIIVCRQEEKKGTGVVLQALPEILKQFPGAHLDVLGDGAALPKFREQAAALGLNEAVTFHGTVPQDEVLRLLGAADLFVFPTGASEGFPKSVLEALASGLPVISTAVSVLPHLLGRGGGGVIVERDPEAVAAGVLSVLTDPDRYDKMSRAAVVTASSRSMENWRDTIGGYLRDAWSRPTRTN